MDIKRIKQLAGLAPIVEAWGDGDFDRYMRGDRFDDFDDEDGLSASEREMVRSADRDLAAKGIKVDDVDPDDDLAHLDIDDADDMEDMDEPAMDAVDAVDDLPADDVELGDDPEADDEFLEPGLPKPAPEVAVDAPVPTAAPDAAQAAAPEANPLVADQAARGAKTAKAREFLKTNPQASRKEFMNFASRELGMGAHYANTLFYSLKKRMVEYCVIEHPTNGRVLAEGSAFDCPIWTTFDKIGFFDPAIYPVNRGKVVLEKLAKNGHKAKVRVEKA